MKIKIPYELRMKFLTHEGLEVTYQSISIPTIYGGLSGAIPGNPEARVKLNLSNDPESLKVCINWMNICYTDYTDYIDYTDLSYKIDLGGYVGLWPNEINSNGVVSFVMDRFDSTRKHWKDWFIIDEEEIENAPK